MLGFDAYNKTMFGAVVRQRIEVFLAKRIIINLPLVVKAKAENDKTFASIFGKPLFNIFKEELEDKGLYFHYALAAIFIQDPDYNFIISEEQDTLQKAAKSLEQQFTRMIDELLFSSPSNLVPPDVNKQNLFSFLLADKENHRYILSYQDKTQLDKELIKVDATGADLLKPFKSVSDLYPPSFARLLGDDFYKQNLERRFKNSDAPISHLSSPFYIEYFYRPANFSKERAKLVQDQVGIFKSDKKLLHAESLKYAGKSDAVASLSKATKDSGMPVFNFVRGVRLVFNVSAAIEQTDSTATRSTITYYPLFPTKFAPLSAIDKFQNKDEDSFPMPFLSKRDFKNSKEFNVMDTFLDGIIAKMAAGPTTSKSPKKDPLRLKADKANRPDADSSLNEKNLFSLKTPLYLTSPYPTNLITGDMFNGKKPYPVNKNYYNAFKDLFVKVNPINIRNNKELISFEKERLFYFTDKEGKFGDEDWINCYFPLILAEYVEETEVLVENYINSQQFYSLGESAAFDPLYKKMIEEEMGQIKFLNQIIDKESLLKAVAAEQSIPDIEKIILSNEDRIKAFEKFEKENIEAEVFYNSLPEPVAKQLFPSGFITPKGALIQAGQSEKDLDNTLLNLITFDEEK